MSIAELLGHEDETLKKYGEILQELETDIRQVTCQMKKQLRSSKT